MQLEKKMGQRGRRESSARGKLIASNSHVTETSGPQRPQLQLSAFKIPMFLALSVSNTKVQVSPAFCRHPPKKKLNNTPAASQPMTPLLEPVTTERAVTLRDASVRTISYALQARRGFRWGGNYGTCLFAYTQLLAHVVGDR